MPFLTITAGHGTTWDLGEVQNGIGISTRGMVFVNISEDGSTAVIGGGTQSGEVIAALWAQGKQTCTLSSKYRPACIMTLIWNYRTAITAVRNLRIIHSKGYTANSLPV